jgi:hypothetical protein
MTENSLKKKRSYGPDVSMIHHGQSLLVEKTYRNRGLPVRIAGILLVFWERFIYSKLQGMAGIPQLMSGADHYTLMTRFMGGDNLRETGTPPDEAYFTALTRLIEEMHARGVIHLDLRNRRNYGIDEKGNPYLVDFASSMYIPFSKTLVRIFALIDWMGYVKVKQRLAPAMITEQENKLLSIGNTLSSWWLPTKALRMVRDIVKKLRA